MDGAKFSARREIPEGLGDDPSPVNPQAFVIPRDGLPSRDLGHGKVASTLSAQDPDLATDPLL